MIDLERSGREKVGQGRGGAREVRPGEVIELFQDPETETKSAGFAFVWAIVHEDKEYFELQVHFLSDPAAPGRKFTRKYRKHPAGGQ